MADTPIAINQLDAGSGTDTGATVASIDVTLPKMNPQSASGSVQYAPTVAWPGD
jgi:hypothetical protein